MIKTNTLISIFLIAAMFFSSIGSCVGYENTHIIMSPYKNIEKNNTAPIYSLAEEKLTSSQWPHSPTIRNSKPYILPKIGLDKKLKIAKKPANTIHYKKKKTSHIKKTKAHEKNKSTLKEIATPPKNKPSTKDGEIATQKNITTKEEIHEKKLLATTPLTNESEQDNTLPTKKNNTTPNVQNKNKNIPETSFQDSQEITIEIQDNKIKVNGKLIGRIINDKVETSDGKGNWKHNKHYTELLKNKIYETAKKKGYAQETKNNGLIIVKMSETDYKAAVKDIAKTSGVSTVAVKSIFAGLAAINIPPPRDQGERFEQNGTNAANDAQFKNQVKAMLTFDYPAAAIAKGLYGSSDSASVSKLISEMKRLGFTKEEISKVSSTIGIGKPDLGSKSTVKKGVIYDKIGKPVGIWNGENAFILNSQGKIIASSKWTQDIKDWHDIMKIANPKFQLTKINFKLSEKIIASVNNVAKGKNVNSAVNSLSRVLTKVNKGTLMFRAIVADLTTKNFNIKKFKGKNVIISTNAILTVLKKHASNKYIARAQVNSTHILTAAEKGKIILRITKNKKTQFIAISKINQDQVTFYDNEKVKKIAIPKIKTYLKKTYKFTKGIAITFNSKVGKVVKISTLKKATAT